MDCRTIIGINNLGLWGVWIFEGYLTEKDVTRCLRMCKIVTRSHTNCMKSTGKNDMTIVKTGEENKKF